MGNFCTMDNQYEDIVIYSSPFLLDNTFQNKRIIQRSKIFVDGRHYQGSDGTDYPQKKIRYIYNSKFILSNVY